MSEGSTFIVEFWDSGAKLEGEFTSAKFPALDKCTQIHTFHMDYQGAATMGHGSGLGGAGVTISPIAIEKSLDKLSTKLFQYCTSGDSLDKVVIHCFMTGAKGGLVEYKTVTAEVCYIESYGLHSGGTGGLPGEHFTVAFKKFHVTDREIEDGKTVKGGNNTYGWDIERNTTYGS